MKWWSSCKHFWVLIEWLILNSDSWSRGASQIFTWPYLRSYSPSFSSTFWKGRIWILWILISIFLILQNLLIDFNSLLSFVFTTLLFFLGLRSCIITENLYAKLILRLILFLRINIKHYIILQLPLLVLKSLNVVHKFKFALSWKRYFYRLFSYLFFVL